MLTEVISYICMECGESTKYLSNHMFHMARQHHRARNLRTGNYIKVSKAKALRWMTRN